MNTFKQFLIEAIPVSDYKPYGKIAKKVDTHRYDHLFDTTEYKTDKNKQRVYIPMTYEISIHDFIHAEEISRHLADQGVEEFSLTQGLVKDKHGRQAKISKFLSPTLMDLYNEDRRKLVKNKDWFVVISRHAYDIVGMSTNRGWTSCMDIYKGEEKKRVEQDIQEGSLVAYLVKQDDKNIEDPTSRIIIKPYRKGKLTILIPERTIYGYDIPQFYEVVRYWCNWANREMESGEYELPSNLYADSTGYKQLHTKNTQELVDLVKSKAGKTIKEINILENGELDIVGSLGPRFAAFFIDAGIKINTISGFYDCSGLNLRSLKYAPRHVTRGFSCFSNKLKNFIGGPEYVGGAYEASNNQLVNLTGLPKEMHDDLDLIGNTTTLKSITGLSQKIMGVVSIDRNTQLSQEQQNEIRRVSRSLVRY